MPRERVRRSGATTLCLLALVPALALAQSAEPRRLTVVAPAAPGGGWDQTARVMQHVLRETGLAASVQVVNVPGAAGTIGLARFVSSESGNPNSLLVTGLVMLSGVATNRSPVTLADISPIARLSGEYEVVVVPAASPIRTLADLIAAFRRDPRAVSWGGGSAGGTDEILVRLLARELGVNNAGVNYVAYSGGGQALAAVLGGHVTAAVSGLGEFQSQIESGDVRAIAISAPRRLAASGSDILTFAEQGVDLVLLNWRAVVAPPGLSRAERTEVTEMVRRMAGSDEWKAALARNGWENIYLDGDAFERYLADETIRVSAVVAASRDVAGGISAYEVMVVGITLVAIVLFALSKRGGHEAGEIREPVDRAALVTLTVAFALTVLLMTLLGFVVAAAASFVLTARAFGSKRWSRDALLGLAFAAVVYLTFTKALGVGLPAGPFG